MIESQIETLCAVLTDESLPAQVPWDELLETARRHGISSLLFWQLKTRQDGEALVPSVVWELLQRDYYTSVGREMLVARQWSSVLSKLAGEGLRVMPFKGAVIAQCYPRQALRAYGDMDILVQNQEIGRAVEVLEELGHRSSLEAVAWSQERHYHLPAMRTGQGLTIELHWRLDRPGESGSLSVEDIWSRADRDTVYGVGVWRMDPIDEALYLCRHGVIQHRLEAGVRACCDLHYLTLNWSEFQWEDLVARALENQLERPLYLLLASTVRFCSLSPAGREVVSDLASRIEVPPGFLDRVQALMVSGRTESSFPKAVVQAAEKPPWDRVRMLWGRVFCPPVAMAQIYDLPEKSPLLAFCYLRRPVDLLRLHAGKMWQLFRGDQSAQRAWTLERELEAWLGVVRPR